MRTSRPEQTVFSIGSDHPSLPGHFPGNPVVPGVVILSHIMTNLSQHLPEYQAAGIRKLKFLQPLLAQQEVCTEFGAIKNDRVRFKCLLADRSIVVEGNLKLARREG